MPGQPGATVTAVVPMFSARDGRYLGALDGAAVTALKCAAVTALVTDRCAVADVSTLAIIGAGTQALAQFAGVSAVREPAEIRIYSRTRAQRRALRRRRAQPLGGARPPIPPSGSAPRSRRRAPAPTSSAPPRPPRCRCRSDRCPSTSTSIAWARTPRTRARCRANCSASSVVFVEDRPTAIAEAGALHADAHELDELDRPDLPDLRWRRTVFSSVGCAWLDLLTCAHLRADSIPAWARAAEPDVEV